MTTAALTTMTAEDLLKMPSDGLRYELVQGELIQESLEGHEHGFLAMEIGWRLARHVEENRLGHTYAAGTGFWIASNPDTVLAPDLAFVSQERLDRVGPVQGFWPGAPDLVVEVVSPSDTYAEVDGKAAAWIEGGARMVLIVNPRRKSMAVHRPGRDISTLGAADTLDADEVVPGWRLRVGELFPS